MGGVGTVGTPLQEEAREASATIDWEAYYQREFAISEFEPQRDPEELNRCRAAWSVFPRGTPRSILDVGCGDGYFCHWIGERTAAGRIAGVDVATERLARGVRRYPEVEFRQAEVGRLPFAAGEFDVVTCIEVLEHLPDPAAALVELGRVASRSVVVTVPDRQRLAQALCPHCLRTFPRDGHLHRFDPQALAALGRRAGLELEACRSHHRPVELGPAWLGRLVRRVERALWPAPGVFLAARYRARGAG